jgi:iron complex outermembrane receptor protein
VKDQNAQTLQEVLRYTAGVRADMYGLDNRADWFALRGGSEGSTLLDGLRVPLTGWYGVVRNEPYGFERVEVLRGPASVIAGQNGPGGVVNLVSKRPQADAVREVMAMVGSNSQKVLAADVGGRLSDDGRLLYRLVALAKDGGTQVDHAFEKRQLFAPSVTWKPLAGTTLTAFAQYQKDTSGNTNAFFPLNGTLLPAPNGPIPLNTFIGEPAWDTYGGERGRVGYHLTHQLNEQWQLRHNLRNDRIQGQMYSMYAAWGDGFRNAAGEPDPNGKYLNRISYVTEDGSRITNGDLLLEGKLNWGNTQHTLLIGADAMRFRGSQAASEGPATPLNVYAPVYGSTPRPPMPSDPAQVSRLRTQGVLLQDQIKIDGRWVLVAGLRRDRATTGDDGAGQRTDSATSRNLGLVWLADGGWSPYTNYSESFEPVAGSDFAGQPFKPKRGKQVEVGIKWTPPGTDITVAGGVYRMKESNRLTNEPEHANFSVQRGVVTVKGVELDVNARLKSWELIGSLTYTDARQTQVYGTDTQYLNQQLTAVPKQQAALWAIHQLDAYGLQGWKAGAGVRYTGTVPDGIGVNEVPSATLLDLLVSYETGPWRLALNVSNATDKTYFASCLDRGDCWFGTKRRVSLSAAYRW